MFRSKKDVDKHVHDIISKIQNENEHNLRGYNFARLYYQVKDYASAKKHLLAYLTVRDHHAPSHKLMAQLYESTNDLERALVSFKRSLDIDPRQKDIVLKICELYCNLQVDSKTAKYWVERADQLFPHHDTVFKLRERILSAQGKTNLEDLESLISSELAAQPTNLKLQLKLLKFYLDSERPRKAYEHAIKVERKRPFPTSLEWYYMLIDVFEAYQDLFGQELDCNFYMLFLTALDHLVFLSMAEPHALHQGNDKNGPTTSSIIEASSILQQFDRHLKKAMEKDWQKGSWLFFVRHMKGQLYLHLGSLAIKYARKEPEKWKELCEFASALFLVGYSFKPTNVLQEVWFSQMDEQQKIFTSFFHQGAMRTSFIGHSIVSLCGEEDTNKWLQKIRLEVCLKQVRDRIYIKFFKGTNLKVNQRESFFLNDDDFMESSLEFPSLSSLLEYDQSSYKLTPHSLHHLVWLHLHRNDMNIEAFESSLLEAFKGLQFSNKNMSRGNPESLCMLDIEAYLLAVLYTTNLFLEQNAALYCQTNLAALTAPPHITEPLCTSEQSYWWQSAHGMVNNLLKDRLGEHRRVLQRGLEVVRGIGNHGLEIQLVVHLARTFADKATALAQDNETSLLQDNDRLSLNLDRVSGLEYRAVHYWNIVLSMLERLSANQALRVPKERMFRGLSETLSPDEIVALREEGQLYLACRLMSNNKLEEAAQLLEKLISPYASYYLALTYKKLACREIGDSNTRMALFYRAREALYTTMDRIKGDHTHTLNEDVFIEVEFVEAEISKAPNGTLPLDVGDTDVCNMNGSLLDNFNSPGIRTPRRIYRVFSTPKPSVSFLSKSRHTTTSSGDSRHVEPSPERLDAQIRALAMTQSTLIKTLMEQQRSLLDTNKAIIDELKQNKDVVIELKKQLEDLKISIRKPRPKVVPRKPPVVPKPPSQVEEEEDEEEYEEYDGNGYVDYYLEDTIDSFQHGNYNYPAGVLGNRAAASAMSYVSSALPPTPNMAHYGYQYPTQHGVPAAVAIPDASHYYQNPLNHGLPFSEGQALPQFRFHVAQSIGDKPAVMNNIGTIPQPVLPLTVSNLVPQTFPTTTWAKTPVPHAFQIPLPASSIGTMPLSTVGTTSGPLAYTTTATSANALDLRSLVANKTPTTPLFNIGTSMTSPLTPGGTPANISGLSNYQTPPSGPLNRSRQDSDVYSDADVEREVMGDFKPVIPLPAEVITLTGEENELTLFESRAKLFRFAESEWKERGIGGLKILKDRQTEVIRLLMRRDQVHKICANHRLLQNMTISYLKGSEKALTWIAHDFADENVKVEHFCIRFKTPEIAADFKKAFEDAAAQDKTTSTKTTPEKPKVDNKTTGFVGAGLPKPGSWECQTCYVNNQATSVKCVACETPRPGINASGQSSDTVTTTTPTKPFTFQPSVLGEVVSKTPTSQTVSFTFSSAGVKTDVPAASGKEVYAAPTTGSDQQKPSFGGFSFGSNDSKASFGGFTFSSKPVVSDKENATKEREILVVSTKSKESPQVTKADSSKSPFSGFSFKGIPDLTSKTVDKSDTPTQLVFGSGSTVSESTFAALCNNAVADFKGDTNGNVFNKSPLSVTITKDGRRVSEEEVSVDFIPTAEFKPVIPLPDLVNLATGEENEEKVYGERVRLYRFESSTKEWKERGVGELKILYQRSLVKYRILMRRDQILKICANHYILPEMKLSPLQSSDRSWVWYAQDFSEGDLKQEQFAAKFRTPEMAKTFHSIFEECRSMLENVKPDKTQVAKVDSTSCDDNQKVFSEMFRPATGSWECNCCYVRNDDQAVTCIACGTNNSTPVKSEYANKPISELFKRDPTCWECQICYVVNTAQETDCMACNTPKSGVATSQAGGAPAAPSGFVFGSKDNTTNSTFQFGSSSLNTAPFSLNFGVPSSAATVFGGNTVSQSRPIPAASATASTFVFGNAANQKEQDEKVGFKFGSPQKYEFSFSGVRPRSPSKSVKSPKSPGTPTDVEDGEDELETSDGDIYFQPVIPLPPKVDVKTGEEGEDILFSKRAKLYRFVNGEWKERGIGDIKILRNVQSNTLRLLMRRDQVHKVCLNHYITKDVVFSWKSSNSLSWGATDYSEPEPSPENFTVRFKLSSSATEFLDSVSKALELCGFKSAADSVRKCLDFAPEPKSPAAQKEPEDKKSPEASYIEKLSSFSFKLETPDSSKTKFGTPFGAKAAFAATSNFFATSPVDDQEVQVLYEVTPTAEQIALAKKLFLPPTFFLYESKPPCPGCRGCDETDVQVVASESKSPLKPPEPIVQPQKPIEQTPKPVETPTTAGSAGDLGMFSNTSLSVFSFAALSTDSTGFEALAGNTSKTAFPGAGTPLFGGVNMSNKDENEEDDGEVVQSADIHFEPVIPLPDIVEVKTGEEDEVQLFCNRAKLYRYDACARQWKERGVGDMKILQHKEKARFRVLLRRELVHKIACNHAITASMALNPMSTSENSLCWNAVDYSDGKAENSQFAIRFKNKEILNQFKEQFEACKNLLSIQANHNSEPVTIDDSQSQVPTAVIPQQNDLSHQKSSGSAMFAAVVAEERSNPIVQEEYNEEIIQPALKPVIDINQVDEEAEDDDDDDEDEDEEDDDDDDEEFVQFSETVTFEIQEERTRKVEYHGTGHIQIIYDDSVYGYRVLVNDDDGATLCEHVIAIQTTISVDKMTAIWVATDVSIDPAKRRSFHAVFPSDQSLNEFMKHFHEGKGLADQSEIAEKPSFISFH